MSKNNCGYLVWNPRHGSPTVAHPTKERAIAESERLAKLNPGRQFFVLEAVGVSIVEPSRVFVPFDRDEIPF